MRTYAGAFLLAFGCAFFAPHAHAEEGGKVEQNERVELTQAEFDELLAGQGAPKIKADVEKTPKAKEDATRSVKSMARTTSSQSIFSRLRGVLGVFVLLGIAFALSNKRSRIDWKLVASGTILQVTFAALLLKTPLGDLFFRGSSAFVGKLLSFCDAGTRLVFGNLVQNSIRVKAPDGTLTDMVVETGSLVAFGVVPTILFFSALSAVLYHLGILQLVVRFLAAGMRYVMNISGAESLGAAANVFIGQSEAPLAIRPFIEKLTRSEVMALMAGGFATVAGGVLVFYVSMLERFMPDIAGHLVSASIMSAPASLIMAKIMVPETEVPETQSGAHTDVEKTDANIIDAATRGTSEGLSLALNVAAMLIGFTALIALVNWCIGTPAELMGLEGMTLQRILGWVLSPLAFLLGVPWSDAVQVGGLMGTKTILNEFLAYLDMVRLLDAGLISEGKSVVIATYALCGFSNFASIGIQVGGLTVIAPSRRKDFAELGLKAMIAASLACFQTAAIAGILL